MKFIHNYLSQYNGESYIYIFYKLGKYINSPNEEVVNKIINCSDFKEIELLISSKLMEFNIKEIEEFFKGVAVISVLGRNGFCFLKYIHIDERYLLFLFESIVDNQNSSKDFNVYRNNLTKISVLCFLHVELNHYLSLNHQEIMEGLKRCLSKYNKIKTYKNNLNKYIDNPVFLEWAQEYIQNKFNITYINNIHSRDYKKIGLLHYFDMMFYKNQSLYIIQMNALKKAWQQKQFRDQGKTKKEYHLPLTKKAKKELSMLAMLKNISENSMLEELIHQAYRDNICDENGKSRY